MTPEQKTFSILSNDLAGLRKNGLRKAVRDALEMVDLLRPAREGYDNNVEIVEFDWRHPPFVPDATRLRRCAFRDDPEYIIPCVEMWEIENTHRLSQRKLRDIEVWLFMNWEGYDEICFELWTCDRFGESRKRLICTAEEHFCFDLIDL